MFCQLRWSMTHKTQFLTYRLFQIVNRIMGNNWPVWIHWMMSIISLCGNGKKEQ